MEVPSLLGLLLRGVAGLSVILVVTYLSDVYGAKSGGLLSAFPTITSVSLIVIAINEDVAFAAESALSTFWGLTAALVFVVGYYYGYRNVELDRRPRTVVATVSGFGVYTLFALPYVLYVDDAGVVNVVVLLGGYAVARMVVREPPSEGPVTPEEAPEGSTPLAEYVVKSVAGGLVVVVATLFADLFGPAVGGVFAAFPGTVAPIIIIISLTKGPAFVYRLASFMPAALLATGGFVLGVWLAYPPLGVVAGTVVAYGCYAVLIISLSRFEDWVRAHVGRPEVGA